MIIRFGVNSILGSINLVSDNCSNIINGCVVKKNKKIKTINIITIIMNSKKFILPITKKNNGLSIYISNENKDFFILFKNYGSIKNIEIGIDGLTHLFEHYVFKNYYLYSDNSVNAFTSYNDMAFIAGSSKNQLRNALDIISFFYDDNYNEVINSPNYFDDSKERINNLAIELENEYMLRKDISSKRLMFLVNKPSYLGGRQIDYIDHKHVVTAIKNLWNSIHGSDIFIQIPDNIKDDLLPLIDKTFAKKQQKYKFKKKKHELLIPENLQNDRYLYITNNNNFVRYDVSFRFDSSDYNFVKRMGIFIALFTNLTLNPEVGVISDCVFLTFRFSTLSNLKQFLYLLKIFDNEDLDYSFVNMFSYKKFVSGLQSDHFNYMVCANYDIISDITKYSMEDYMYYICVYFACLKKKIYEPGSLVITGPNSLIYTNINKYNELYDISVSSIDLFFKDIPIFYNYNWDAFKVPNFTLLNKFDLLFRNSETTIVCEYNISKCVEINKYPYKKIYSEYDNLFNMEKCYMPLVSQFNLNLVCIYDDYITVTSKDLNKINMIKEIVENNNKIYLKDVNTTIKLDLYYDLLCIYFYDATVKFSQLVYQVIHNNFNSTLEYYYRNNNVSSFIFNEDKDINIKTSHGFVFLFFITNKNDSMDLSINPITQHFKSKGLLYYYREYKIYKEDKVYNYVFIPSVVPDMIKDKAMRYIKSFNNVPIVSVISNVSNSTYDFTELDNLINTVKILK